MICGNSISAMSLSSIVLPVFGCATIIPRWSLPQEKRFIIRVEILLLFSQFKFSSGWKTGVKCLKPLSRVLLEDRVRLF
jgi:hypothetical protein